VPKEEEEEEEEEEEYTIKIIRGISIIIYRNQPDSRRSKFKSCNILKHYQTQSLSASSPKIHLNLTEARNA